MNTNRSDVDTTSLADMFRTCSGPSSEKLEFQMIKKEQLEVKVDVVTGGRSPTSDRTEGSIFS